MSYNKGNKINDKKKKGDTVVWPKILFFGRITFQTVLCTHTAVARTPKRILCAANNANEGDKKVFVCESDAYTHTR